MYNKEKLIVYQIFPRIFTNITQEPTPNGTLEQNGSGKLADYDEVLLRSLKEMGINCLWLTGVIEHATKTDFSSYGILPDNPNVVKGEAGSPYAIKDYYDIDPAIAVNVDERMAEFEDAVNRIHKEKLKVIIDFVPNHTARQYNSDVAPEGVDDFGTNDDNTYFFKSSNNYYYIPNQQFAPSFPLDREGVKEYKEFPAKATGNDCFTAFCGENDWYETVKLNYGFDPGNHSEHFDPIPDTWIKMRDILEFWASKGVDGFRCDMVFMVPLAFWHWVIPEIKSKYPEIIFIGEIYDVSLYRAFLDWGKFDYLYDKVNLYDTLVGIERNNYSAARLTSCWQTVDGIGDRMLNFLENHDEVRYGSPEFAGNPAKVLPALVASSMISRGPFMIYYGQELGESACDNEGFAGNNNRSTIFDYWSYDTVRRWYDGGECTIKNLTQQEKWLRATYSKVLNLCNSEEAISRGEFFDLMYVNLDNPGFNPHRQFAFLRYTENQVLLIILNFDDKETHLHINVPDLAIEMAKITLGDIKAKELLTATKENIKILSNQAVKVTISPNGAKVLQLK